MRGRQTDHKHAETGPTAVRAKSDTATQTHQQNRLPYAVAGKARGVYVRAQHTHARQQPRRGHALTLALSKRAKLHIKY